MKKNCIITAIDKKYGDFLIEHWYYSLKENVTLDNIDIVVIDYGLSKAQSYYLTHHGVKLFKAPCDGHIAVIRFRDIYQFLEENTDYDQVLICDSGDIIFQSDISSLFKEHKGEFRAAYEDYRSAFFKVYLNSTFFSDQDKAEILPYIQGEKTINAGFLLGPRSQILELCSLCVEMIIDKTKFGPDQIVINYVLQKNGFQELDKKFNYVISVNREEIMIKEGVFYYKSGEKIPVVHNSGNYKFLRPIDDFRLGRMP